METKERVADKKYVGVKEIVTYGVANGGQCLGYNLMRGWMNVFLLSVIKVPGTVIGTMTIIMGIWDAFNDPLMGSIVDRTRTRYGKLRPYLIFVPIPLGIVTTLFFCGGEILKNTESVVTKTIFVCITYFIWEFFYTIGDIPYWGLSAAISPNPDDRSRAIKSARFVSGIVGALPGLVMPICIDITSADNAPFTLSQAFMVLGIIAGTVGMYLFSLSGTKTKERVMHVNDEPKLLDCFRFLLKNKPLLLIVLSNILATVEGIGGAFSPYFYKLALDGASLSLVAGIPGTVAGFFTYAVMGKLEKRWHSRKIIINMSIIHCCVTVAVFFLGLKHYTNMAVVTPLMMLMGVSGSINSSIKMVIPTKMIAETVDYMEWKTAKRNEGMAFSVLTFMGKLTSSWSSAIAAFIFPLIGLAQVGDSWELAANSGVDTLFWLWALVTCGPTILGLIALVPYLFYDLEGDKLKKIQSEIKVKQDNLVAQEASSNG